jgi:hypothetical protein
VGGGGGGAGARAGKDVGSLRARQGRGQRRSGAGPQRFTVPKSLGEVPTHMSNTASFLQHVAPQQLFTRPRPQLEPGPETRMGTCSKKCAVHSHPPVPTKAFFTTGSLLSLHCNMDRHLVIATERVTIGSKKLGEGSGGAVFEGTLDGIPCAVKVRRAAAPANWFFVVAQLEAGLAQASPWLGRAARGSQAGQGVFYDRPWHRNQ